MLSGTRSRPWSNRWSLNDASLRLDARELDHLRPFLSLIADEFAEISGCAGSARQALISLLSLPMTALGVFRGALTPYQALASYPGMNSASVGISGSTGERVVVVTAKARNLPWRINPIEPGRLSKVTCTRFIIRSVYASASPR